MCWSPGEGERRVSELGGARLAALFGLPSDASLDGFERAVERRIAELGLPKPATILDADDEDAGEDDPRELLWWLCRMAISSYRRACFPLEEKASEAFVGALEQRPRPELEHAQMFIDADSAWRRALKVAGDVPDPNFLKSERGNKVTGPVLFVGDDDATSLAFRELAPTSEAVVLDIDEQLLDYLRERSGMRCERFDVFEDVLPEELQGQCSAVVTDPIRSFEPCLAFVDVAVAALRPGGLLYWADHPDWNLELTLVERAMKAKGMVPRHRWIALHRYPLDETWVRDLDAKAERLGVKAEWLRDLVAEVSGWTHLYLWEKAPR